MYHTFNFLRQLAQSEKVCFNCFYIINNISKYSIAFHVPSYSKIILKIFFSSFDNYDSIHNLNNKKYEWLTMIEFLLQ